MKKLNNETYQKKIFSNIKEEIVEAMRILELYEMTNVKKYLETLLETKIDMKTS